MRAIPEKWFIIRTKENADLVNAYENRRSGFIQGAFLEGHSYFYSDKQYSSEPDISGYTEITFDEFKKYTLIESIIGIKDNYLIF